MAAIDLYNTRRNQFSSSSSSSSSDQELMKALEPFIRSASSPTSSTSASSPFSNYPHYYSLSPLPQESYYFPASSSSYTALQAPFATPATTTTSFSQLPPLPPTSHCTSPAVYPPTNDDVVGLASLGPQQIHQIQAQLFLQHQQQQQRDRKSVV